MLGHSGCIGVCGADVLDRLRVLVSRLCRAPPICPARSCSVRSMRSLWPAWVSRWDAGWESGNARCRSLAEISIPLLFLSGFAFPVESISRPLVWLVTSAADARLASRVSSSSTRWARRGVETSAAGQQPAPARCALSPGWHGVAASRLRAPDGETPHAIAAGASRAATRSRNDPNGWATPRAECAPPWLRGQVARPRLSSCASLRLLCAFTVISLMPSSPPTCLFNSPETTNAMTWRSRGVSDCSSSSSARASSESRRSATRLRSMAPLNGLQQHVVLERLGQKLDCARFHRLHTHRHVAMAGDEDDRHVVPAGRAAAAVRARRAREA